MKRKVLFGLCLLMIIINIEALSYNGCDYSDISKLRLLAKNINISYSYHIESDDVYFDITVNNITPDIYFKDIYRNKVYRYEDTINGEITIKNYSNNLSGPFKFYSNLKDCQGTILETRYYSFPIYNPYYKDDMCVGITNFDMCKKWVKSSISYDVFVKGVQEYKKLMEKDEVINNPIYTTNRFDKIVEFYIKYYYYFLGGIIIICLGIIYFKKKKNNFNL